MIASEAEARVALGLSSSITDDERAAIMLFLPAAEEAVINEIGYDPFQREVTEYYPRNDPSGGIGVPDNVRDISSSGRSAESYAIRSWNGMFPSLQLSRLPIRDVADLRVDYDAKHGQSVNSFASGSAWTQGSDFWVEFEQPNYSPSGCLFSRRSWPLEPGTVSVQYTAGYSPDELAGRVESTGVDDDGYYNRVGVNASGLKRAVLLTVIAQMHKWAAHKKDSIFGFVPGPKQSERLGDYQYTLSGNSGDLTAGLTVELPGAAVEQCEPFRHWGRMRL